MFLSDRQQIRTLRFYFLSIEIIDIQSLRIYHFFNTTY